jgi:hypothetical protein
MRTFPRLLVVLAVAALAAPPVRAEEPEEWTFTVAPYVWFAGLEGDVAAIPGLPVASINASFGDIFEHLDPSLMLAGEVRNEQFGILFDIVYVHLSADGETPGPLFNGVDADIRNFIGTLEGAYRVYGTNSLKVDLLGGIRVWTVDTELSLGAGVLPARSADSKETWADPLVGVRARVDVGSGFFVNAWGNVGGFGAASDLTWDVYGGLGYEWNGWLSSIIGYRHLEVDYDHEGFLYDVSQSGPIIGAVLRF